MKKNDLPDSILSEEKKEQDISSFSTVAGEYTKSLHYGDPAATGNTKPQEMESLVDIEFSAKPDAIPSLPSGEGESRDYPVSLSLKGSHGSDLSNSEARKGDLNIEWKFCGFNILNGELTYESGPDENGYAVMGDSYITLSGFTKTSTSGNINIRNGVGNYYCVVSVTATYGGKATGYNRFTKSFPMAVLANKTAAHNQIYPAAGYPVNLNHYSDDIVGYRAYQSDNSSNNPDPLLSNWNSWGSKEGSLTLQKDAITGDKYLLATSGGNCDGLVYIVNNIGNFKEEITADMDINFDSPGISIVYIQGNTPFSEKKISLDFDGSKLSSGADYVGSLTSGAWYKLKISYNSGTCKYGYEVYTPEGNLIGKSGTLDYPSGVQSPAIFGFICANKNSTVKFKNLVITKTTEAKPISGSFESEIHGLSYVHDLSEARRLAFDFGNGTKDDTAEGYIPVTPSTVYPGTLGYGFTSAGLVAGGDPSADKLNGDYIEGEEIVFKVNLKAGKNYDVKIVYQGALFTEVLNDPATGVIRTPHMELAENNYSVPLVDGVLDFNLKKITLDDGTTINPRIASVEIILQPDKEKGDKPTWFTYGDSTTNSYDLVKNNVSWGNVASEYTTMFNIQNRAAGGRNPVTFYNQGKLDGILLDLRPEDIVTFNGMGTNSYNSYFKDHMNYAIDGVLQRGGIPVIVTYTPHGPVSRWADRYDSKTQTFNSARDSDGYTKVYREVAAERNDVYFIDLGNLVNDRYNQMVKEARNKVIAEGGSEADAWAAGEAEAQRIIGMFNDHNHYHREMADIIAPIMVKEVEELYKRIKNIKA